LALFEPLPAAIERAANGWSGCAAGMLTVQQYTLGLRAAGFRSVESSILRSITEDDLMRENQPPPTTNGIETWTLDELSDAAGRFGSVLVSAGR